jgi:ATP-binding cassette, subfamily B, bacterial
MPTTKYLKISFKLFIRVFKTNPIATTLYLATFLFEALNRIVPLLLISDITYYLLTNNLDYRFNKTLIWLTIFWLLNHIVKAFQRYQYGYMNFVTNNLLERDLFLDIEKLSVASINKPDFKERLINLNENYWRVFNFFNGNFLILSATFSAILATLEILKISYWIALIFLTIMSLELVNGFASKKKFVKKETLIANSRRKYWYQRYYLLHSDGIIEFKNLLAFKKAVELISNLNSFVNLAELKIQRRQSTYSAIIGLQVLGLKVYILISLIRGYLSGKFSDPSEVQKILFMAFAFESSLENIFRLIGEQQKDFIYASQTIEIKNYGILELLPNKSYFDLPLDTTPTIKLVNLSYKAENSDSYILEGINMSFLPAKIYGLCGESGAGKTTLLKLLTKEYELLEGEILIEEINLKDLNPHNFRSLVGYLPQNFFNLDSYTVRDSIEIVERKDGFVPISEVLKIAEINFLGSNNKDLEATIGGNFLDSREFSGGERQRIALARHLFKNPNILILDEPTSQLDASTEDKVIMNLFKWARDKNKTVIMVSHQFSNLKEVDEIYYLAEGKVVETGTPQELLDLGGNYAKLFNRELIGKK